MAKLLHRWVQKIDGSFERVSLSPQDCIKIEYIWDLLKKLGFKSTQIDKFGLNNHVKNIHNNNTVIKSRRIKFNSKPIASTTKSN